MRSVFLVLQLLDQVEYVLRLNVGFDESEAMVYAEEAVD